MDDHYGLRRRIDEALRRRGSTEADAQPLLAVGFVDLVGFTRASSGLDTVAFSRILDRFESLAWDEVTEAGGRLVKLIGDEAMFVCPPIVADCGRGELPPARAGIAAGQLIVRGGDHFGSVVNLASRLVDVADAGTVAVDQRYRALLQHSAKAAELEELGRRQLKGIGNRRVWRVKPDAVSAAKARDS